MPFKESNINSFTIDLEPIGRRVNTTGENTLLQVAQSAGIQITALCGGEGWCGKCRVRIIEGNVSPLTADEQNTLSEEDLQQGIRLACQTKPLSDIILEILPEFLSTSQRLQIEGVLSIIENPLDSLVTIHDLSLNPPNLDDLSSDLTRLETALQNKGIHNPETDLPFLQQLSDRLRQYNWQIRAVTYNNHLIDIFPPQTPPLGIAIDIGSTKIAAYLVDLEQSKVIAKGGAVNPQVAYGDDVVSRIAFANQHAHGKQVLQEVLITKLNELISELCHETSTSSHQIVAAVAVGNTVIHHLFLGLSLRQLGETPYIPTISSAMEIPAREIGLTLAPSAQLYLPPVIAGYVGADHVSMLLAANVLQQTKKIVVALDIGTNTEISLFTPHQSSKPNHDNGGYFSGRLVCCSCASGPAFEGAHIHNGMRAVPGAIEHVQFRNGNLYMYTIESKPPIGICGSGILDAIAELYRIGAIDSAGRLKKDAIYVRAAKGGGEFVLVPAGKSGNAREIVVTRRDVNEIQLAKGAIRAGVEILLHELGLSYHDIDEFIIAGAFGTYLDIESAIRIGMFPPLPKERFKQIGNAAGMGAVYLLLSRQARQLAEQIAQNAEYIELTIHPHFRDIYVKALNFE